MIAREIQVTARVRAASVREAVLGALDEVERAGAMPQSVSAYPASYTRPDTEWTATVEAKVRVAEEGGKG